MSEQSYENLKMIRFEDELLPHWASLLDLAARLCSVSTQVCDWFSRFTSSNGVDDACTVLVCCEELRAALKERRGLVVSELKHSHDNGQAAQIVNAWLYALDTMMQVAATRKTCSWGIAGTENAVIDDSDGGDVTLRRV